MTPVDELHQAADILRTQHPDTGEARALADLLEAVSTWDDGLEEDHGTCNRTVCISAAALDLARLLNIEAEQ